MQLQRAALHLKSSSSIPEFFIQHVIIAAKVIGKVFPECRVCLTHNLRPCKSISTVFRLYIFYLVLVALYPYSYRIPINSKFFEVAFSQ